MNSTKPLRLATMRANGTEIGGPEFKGYYPILNKGGVIDSSMLPKADVDSVDSSRSWYKTAANKAVVHKLQFMPKLTDKDDTPASSARSLGTVYSENNNLWVEF